MSALKPIIADIFAHQGGWDEILLVGGPIVLIIALLAVAKRRVDAAAAQPDDQAGHRTPADS